MNKITSPINDLILLLLRFDSMTDITIVCRKEVSISTDSKAELNQKIIFEEYLAEGK